MQTEVNKITTDYLIDISKVNVPLNLGEIFSNDKKVSLEIGFGEGEFLTDMAHKHPSQNFLGLEIKRYRFLKAIRNAMNFNLDNIKFIHIDAGLALRQIFRYRSFDNIYINFPDPWPKSRHNKHRIFNQELLHYIYNVLSPNGNIYIASDHEDYIVNIMETIKNTAGLRLSSVLKRTPDSALTKGMLTRFEKEFIDEGKNIYYLNYIKG